MLTVVAASADTKDSVSAPWLLLLRTGLAAKAGHSLQWTVCGMTNHAEKSGPRSLRDLCGWVAVELEVNGLLAVTSTAFAVGAAFA